jgi:hypothetical protein
MNRIVHFVALSVVSWLSTAHGMNSLKLIIKLLSKLYFPNTGHVGLILNPSVEISGNNCFTRRSKLFIKLNEPK